MSKKITEFRTESVSFIYGLVDPHTGLIRYIGKTSYGRSRILCHWSKAHSDRTHKGAWLRKLRAEGEECEVEVLEELSKELLSDAERRWIAYGRKQGWPLTNLTDGGEGMHGHRFTEEHKSKISAAMKGRTYSPERLVSYRAMRARIGPPRPRGFKMSEEHKEKIRQALINRSSV